MSDKKLKRVFSAAGFVPPVATASKEVAKEEEEESLDDVLAEARRVDAARPGRSTSFDSNFNRGYYPSPGSQTSYLPRPPMPASYQKFDSLLNCWVTVYGPDTSSPDSSSRVYERDDFDMYD